MSEISEERIAELLKLCDDREKPLIVGYGMAVVFTADLRALIASHRALAAAKEEGERLRGELQAIYWWLESELKDHIPGTPKLSDSWKMNSLLLQLRAVLQHQEEGGTDGA